MTEEELAKIPRRTIDEISASIPGGIGHHQRTMVAMEAHANVEWWRGYYAGRCAQEQERRNQSFAPLPSPRRT
jgi:hypothetical protein